MRVERSYRHFRKLGNKSGGRRLHVAGMRGPEAPGKFLLGRLGRVELLLRREQAVADQGFRRVRRGVDQEGQLSLIHI